MALHGSHEKAIENAKGEDEIWPPMPTTPKLLFDYFYADKIREKYGKEETKKKFAGKSTLMEKINIFKK